MLPIAQNHRRKGFWGNLFLDFVHTFCGKRGCATRRTRNGKVAP